MNEKYTPIENKFTLNPEELIKAVNIEEKFPYLCQEPIFIKHPELLKNPTENIAKILETIHYENMKLNAQVEVLNKTVDKNSEKIEKLKNINYKLQQSNKELTDLNEQYKKNNKHSTIKAAIIAISGALIGLLPTIVSYLRAV